MMFGGMLVFAAASPGQALAFDDQFRGIAQRQPAFGGKYFRALSHQHHMFAIFEHGARQPDGIAYALDGRHRSGAQRLAIHHHGVQFHAAVAIQVRTDAGVEDRIIFKNQDRRLYRIQCPAASRQNLPARLERAPASGLAISHGFVGDIPGAAVDDERRPSFLRLG